MVECGAWKKTKSPANHNELDELKKRHASTATLRYNSRAACVEKAISGDYTSCEQIAKDLGKPAEWVCKWLKRFIKKGISGLRNDAPRSGRPTTCVLRRATLCLQWLWIDYSASNPKLW